MKVMGVRFRERDREEDHRAVTARLDVQEDKTRRMEVRLKRLELELGIVYPDILQKDD